VGAGFKAGRIDTLILVFSAIGYANRSYRSFRCTQAARPVACGMAELPSPKQASAILLDGKWTWRDALAILALLVAGLTALEQHGVIDLAPEVEPAPVVEPEVQP
jgi:hypothetical protein